MNRASPSRVVVPVVTEQATFGSERHEVGAVRVRIESDERREPLAGEERIVHAEVRRVPRGVAVEAARAPWTEGDTLVVPVYAERVELVRTLVLTEEIRIERHAETRRVEASAALRHERAFVERRGADGRWHEVDATRTGASPPPPERNEP